MKLTGWQRAGVCAVAVLCGGAPARGAPQNPDTDWFRDAGWGVFVHWLWDVQNVGDRPNTQGKPAVSLDAWVNGFDVEAFAAQVKESGANYVMFTMMQRTRYLVAPNETYEKLTGYKRGEATAHRDLVEDLYAALHKRGIPLLLYWTGDGPRQDPQAAAGMGGWSGQVTDAYVENWARVAAEYSRRYGEKVRGWWVDGCYSHIGYNEKRWSLLATGLKAGNPHAIVALNNPSMRYANSSTAEDDFTTGEVNALSDIPEERWRDGKQFHVLSYLGANWGLPDCRYTLAFLADYIGQVTAAGGVVTLDVALYRDGTLDPAQVKLLSQLPAALAEGRKAIRARTPAPPGNLASWKPARLRSLDGARNLQANGGGGKLHLARCGVDGDPATAAQAGGEWPWTYAVDLEGAFDINRAVVTFGKSFATHAEFQVSADGQAWTTVAEVRDHDGSKWAIAFAPARARQVRVRALKPDGEGQPGSQMSIAELEVYGAAAGAAPAGKGTPP